MTKETVRACVVSVMLLTAGRAQAQPFSGPSETDTHSLKIATDVYVGAMVADWVTTQAVLSNGGHESDPIARPFVGHGMAPALIGATIDASLTYLGVRLAQHHRKVGRVVLWIAACARTAIVINNARAMQR